MRISSSKTRQENKANNTVGVLRVPQGIDLWKVEKPGMYQMVILPYKVPDGAKHPYAKPGEFHYSRDYYIHRNFGPSGKDYAICPRLTVGAPCPICEAIKQQLAAGNIDKDTAKKMSASHRTLYNVWLPKENKVVLFDTSFFGFTEVLNAAVDAKVQIPGMEWADYFADPVEGSTLYVQYVEQPLPSPGAKFCKAISIDFVQHKEAIPAEILSQAVSLDLSLVVENYDVLKNRFWDTEPVATESAQEQETPVTRTQVAVTQPQTPKSAPAEPPAVAPKVTGFTKGQILHHKDMGEVSFVKSSDGSATVLNSQDDPVKVKMSDLQTQPWPDSQSASLSEPVAVSNGGDDAWDSGWKD
jgi:hypothetical protein